MSSWVEVLLGKCGRPDYQQRDRSLFEALSQTTGEDYPSGPVPCGSNS